MNSSTSPAHWMPIGGSSQTSSYLNDQVPQHQHGGDKGDQSLSRERVHQYDPSASREDTLESPANPSELSYVGRDRGGGGGDDVITVLHHHRCHHCISPPVPQVSLQPQPTRNDLLHQPTSPTPHALLGRLSSYGAANQLLSEELSRKSSVVSSCCSFNPPLLVVHTGHKVEASTNQATAHNEDLLCSSSVGLARVTVQQSDLDSQPSALSIGAPGETVSVRSEKGVYEQDSDQDDVVPEAVQHSLPLRCTPPLSQSLSPIGPGGAARGSSPPQPTAALTSACAAGMLTSPPPAALSVAVTAAITVSARTLPTVMLEAQVDGSLHGIQLRAPRVVPHVESPPLHPARLPALSSIAEVPTPSASLGDGVKRDEIAVTATQQSPGSSTNGLSVLNFHSGGTVPTAVSVVSPLYSVGTLSVDDYMTATKTPPLYMSQCQVPPPLHGSADAHKQHQQLLSTPQLHQPSSLFSGFSSTSSAVGHVARQRPSRFRIAEDTDRAAGRPSVLRPTSPCAPIFTSDHSRHIPVLSGNALSITEADRCNGSLLPLMPPASSSQAPVQSSGSTASTPHIPALDFSTISDGPLVRNGEVLDAPWWGSSGRRSSLPSPYVSAICFSHGCCGDSGGSDFSGYGEDDDETEDISVNRHPVNRKAEELQRLRMYSGFSNVCFSSRFDDADVGSNDEDCIEVCYKGRPLRGSVGGYHFRTRSRAAAASQARGINNDASRHFLRGFSRGQASSMLQSRSGSGTPLLQHVPAPAAMTSLPLHQGHIADNISTPGGDASLLYPPLTPKREVELRAKGRQLLDEHRREVAEKGLPYTAEEVALMREQGRELLRASREAAAANGGHHVPAPLLSAAVRAAAAPAHPSRLLIDASGVSFEGGRSGATQSTSEPTQQPYDNGAMTSPLNTQQSATVDGGIPCAREKPTFSDSTAVQLPSSPAHLQDLLEEVQRLQSLVAAQEAQLHAQQSSAGLTTEELLTKSHVDALRKSLIEQFNEHMAQCEQANQTYWEKVTAQHQREVCALQAECAQHKQRAAEAEALAQGQQSKHDARNEESSDVTATLRLDVTRLEGELQLARQQSSDAQTARDSLAATATHLSSTVEAQRAMIIQLQQELSSANTQLQAVREEAQHALNENERALNASRLEILNLHTSLREANEQLEAACASAAAAAPPAHDGANPFADAEDPFAGPPRVVAPAVGDAELDAARQRIAELEAANAELQVANESAGRAWRECLAKLDAERQVVVDLEDALDVAAGDLEGLHEDLEEKSRLIQALRAGEAALGCLSVDTTGSIGANGWTLAPSPEKARKGMCEGGSENSAEVLHVLRCRVADLTHELETMRHQQEGMSVSAMVPGMEALGRQYAEHERRLVLAEEARAALEEEVQRLRGKATSVSGRWMSEDGRDREGSGEQASSLDGRNAHTTAMETPPASLVDPLHVPPNGDGAEGGMVSSAVQPPHVSTTMKLQSAPENFACSKGGSTPTGSATRLVTRDKQTPASLPAMPVAALSEGPKQNEGECGRSASLTLASLNGSRDCQASRRGGVIPGTLRHESGDGEGLISAEEDVACQWAASSCMVLSAPDRDSEVCDAVSTGWNNEVDFNLPHRCSRDIDVDGDEDDVNTEACNVSISTRVTALHGRQGAHNAAVEERVDDSSVTMQELGRRYADAQQRLYSSEEARQSLEVGVEGLQTVVTRQPQRMSPGVCASRAVGNEADPLTVTTSFASSVPTAARERPIKQGCPGKNASPPTTTSSRPGGGDDAESGSFGSALYSEPGVSVTTTAAPAHDDGSGGRQNRLATATIEDTAALHERIVELENRLSDMEAQHEEELQALAEAAADRIEAIEEQYAEDLAAAQKTAATAGEGCQANLETTTSLMRQVRQLTESLADARSAHAAELRTLREEHEVLLQRRLSEQENSFEAVIWKLDQQHRDQLRILASAGETGGHALTGEEGVVGTALSSLPPEEDKRAQYWEEQHATLLKRFEQLQREYDALTYGTGAQQRSCYEEGADRQEQPQSRAVRDAAAAQLETLHRRLEEMDKVVKAAQTDAQDRSDELRDFTARHAEHEAALRAELDNLRSQVQSAHDELARANNLNEELSELLQQGATSVETAMRERDAQHTALEQQVQQLKQQLAMAEDRLADRQAALQEQGVNADALQRRLFEMEEEKRAAEARLREGQRNAEEAERATVNAANRAARDAEQARVAVQEAMVQEHATHKQEIAALHRELDELRAELEAAQTVAATVPLEVQRHQRDLGTVRDRLTEALRSQQELQQELKSSRAEVERQRLLLMREGIGNSTDADDCGTSPSLDAHLNALLHRNEELGERLRDAASEQDRLQEERDRLSMQVKSAARVVEVKEQAMRRQEAELRSVRSQLSTVRDDLSQRVQTNHALQVEIDHLQERLEDTTNAYEKLQGIHMETVSKSGMLGHAVALLTAKAVTIPRALEEYVEVVLSAYNTLLQTASRDRRHIYDRCDLIEKAAAEAMAEAEEQNRVYEAAIADAQEEQQQMKEIIEGLQQAVQKAEEAKIAAVADATAARSDLEATRRQAREDVFNAQRDLQAAELRQADTLHSLSLLQEEVTNTADLIRTQKRNYDRREEELMERVTRLQGEVEASNSAARQLQQAADESRRELQSIADSAVQAQDRAVHDAQALQTQLARVLPRLAQLEDEQAQRTADLMDTAQQLSALHKKTTSAECVSRKHIDELNQTLEQLLQAHTTLQQTHTSTEATADRLRSQLANVTQELERTTKRVTEQEEELTKVRAQLHELETCTSRVMADDQARLRDSERRLQGLVQRNTALQQECDALQESLQSLRIEHESTVDALNRKSEAFVAQDKLMNHQVRLLRERVSTLEVERQELMSSTESLTAARDRCQRDALSLEHQLEHLQHHLRTSNEHSERLNQEMVQLKTDHSTEVDRLRESITDAQKELAKCRQLLTQAEARQVEQESTHYSLSAEVSALREELRGVRALAEKATEEYRKSKMRQEETVTVLQSQVSQLNEDLRGKEDQVRMLENTSAHQEDTIHGLRQDIAEAMASLKHTRQELLNQKEAAAAAREHHRRDRCELQEKLNDAEDAMAEMTRSQEQYRQRMTSKVELYEVSEQALRGEVCDLRADVARLEEALAATTHRKVTAETHQSRQAQSIKAAESELQTLRSQTVHDMTEIAALKLQLQQRTSEVERCRREAPAQLTSERHLWEVEHMAACDALEEALRQEQQANKDAREARERALAALASKQEDVIAMESKCRSLREKERQLRRRFDAAQSQLTLLEGLAKTTADDLGITLRGLLGDKEGTLVDAAPHSHDISVDSTDSDVAAAVAAIAVSGAAVQTVMDELQRRLSIFTLAAHSLDSEDDQLVELRKALEQQEDAVQLLVEACAGEGLGSTSSATPLRSGTAGVDVVTPGLNNTPTPSFTKSVGAPLASSGAVSTAVVHLRSVLTSAQRVFVQRIGQASSTYVHRVEDHLRTSRQMLRSVMMAMGSYEMVSQPAGRPTTAALSSRHKLQVSATVAELHRRTAALTRAVERMLDLVVRGEGAQSPALCSSPQSLNGNMFEGQLQELRRLFSEAESYVLRPFNELLCVSESPLVRTAASAAVDEESAVGEEPPPPPPPHQSFSCTESDGWGG